MIRDKKYLGFAVFTIMIISAAVAVYSAGTIDLPRTGQTGCWDKSGAPVSCVGTGQDGDTLAGTPWPSPRFEAITCADGSSNCIKDNLTGLIWAKAANSPGPTACSPTSSKKWTDALLHIKCLNDNNYLSHNDWRLPNVLELNSLFNTQESNVATWLQDQGFTGLMPTAGSGWWASTTYAEQSQKGWMVYFRSTLVTEGDSKTSKTFWIWPVRDGI